jgi:predicted ATPase/class 3 adenylate cyclase
MAELPTGTVTFLFTDIEGSTWLLQQLGERYASVLLEHRRVLCQAFQTLDGRVVDTQGDALFVAFPRAIDAATAAVTAQRALAAHPWPVDCPVRVRMGLHTGEPTLTGGAYIGLDVHRAARLATAGHGGQILVSQTTRDLVEQALPPETSVRDLGDHRLKDLQQPEHIFQLVTSDLPVDFPPLRTLNTLPNNLPTQLTSFVGRERAMADIEDQLSRVRLLTLVGAGGAGKTRLALQVAANLLEHYPDGAWLVELAALADPAFVPQVVASALGLRDDIGRPLPAVLADHLERRRLLLLLDNCEHLIAACASLAETLLLTCPRLRIVATSREALGIAGETTWRVPPLVLPDPHCLPPLDRLLVNEAVRLFGDRAGSALPGFIVTNENASAVTAICQRLDGIPLAIELAAVRVKVLSPEQIVARLDDRFRLLTAGSRTALPRQQTLRALVDWSHDLLTASERILFRRLAVFAGGWSLEAAEGVCAGEGIDAYEMLGLLAQLVDKSLVLTEQHGSETRYRLLETLRQYAAEKLRAAGEEERLPRRHCAWFAALVERETAQLRGPGQVNAFAQLELEYENLRAALDWCETEPGSCAVAAQIADDLGWFWELRGHVREGRERLDRLLALVSGRTEARARALSAAGLLAHHVGEYAHAAALLDESIEIWRELGDQRGTAIALARFGQLEQSCGNYDRAWTLLEESRALFREVGAESGIDAPVAVFLAQVAKNRGDHERAISLFEDCLRAALGQGDTHAAASALRSLGELTQMRGDYERAAARLAESLRLLRELDDRSCAGTTLDSLAVLSAAHGDPKRAARLFAAAQASREAQSLTLPPPEQERLNQAAAAARMELDRGAFDAAWAEGRAMTLDQAVAYALNERP